MDVWTKKFIKIPPTVRIYIIIKTTKSKENNFDYLFVAYLKGGVFQTVTDHLLYGSDVSGAGKMKCKFEQV